MNRSVGFHGISVLSSPLLLNPIHKIINHTRPSSILAIKRQTIIIQRLNRKLRGLIPHILANRLGPVLLQVLGPEAKPVGVLGLPLPGRCREQHVPVNDRSVEWHGFLARLAGKDEGVAVDALEVVSVFAEL